MYIVSDIIVALLDITINVYCLSYILFTMCIDVYAYNKNINQIKKPLYFCLSLFGFLREN